MLETRLISRQTKRDLGFMEGDLIECLNAGDGSWWTGRLRRDPRMVGVFPSNFVQVLSDTYRPVSRSPSPMPTAPSPKPSVCDKQPSWRAPFSGYKQHTGGIGPASAGNKPEKASRRPFSSMAVTRTDSKVSAQTAAKPKEERPKTQLYDFPARRESTIEKASPSYQYPASSIRHSPYEDRSASPNPKRYYAYRPPSPNPMTIAAGDSRAPSPNPMVMTKYTSRVPTPDPFSLQDDDAPPPPPPHRYAASRAPSPNPSTDQMRMQATRTPEPRFDDDVQHMQKNTPSPFTSAFNDIMDTFEDMTVQPKPQSPKQHEDFPKSDIWGPDDYEQLYGGPPRARRAHTSMATSQPDSGYNTGLDGDLESHKDVGSVQLDDYVSRMEKRLKELSDAGYRQDHNRSEDEDIRPPLPAKNSPHSIGEKMQRPFSAFGTRRGSRRLKKQKSAYELATQALGRTFTLKSTVTTTTESSNSTNQSVWSGASAGQMSNASAGSYYNNKLANKTDLRPTSSVDFTKTRPETPLSGPSYHSSHDSNLASMLPPQTAGLLGGLNTPSKKKSGFIRKMLDSARASAATARSTMSANGSHSRPSSRSGSPTKLGKHANSSMVGIAGGTAISSVQPHSNVVAHDMGLGNGMDWVQVRRDVHRSNSLGKNERRERAERAEMMEITVLAPIEELYRYVEGDEGLDGLAITDPTDFTSCNLAMVDKSARFVANLPASTTVPSLVQGYLCRPYRSDVQRLRAIFTWTSERISWEEDFEGATNSRRVLQTKRGCSQEIAVLVAEMCHAIGIQAEVVHGHLKIPGEMFDMEHGLRPNHWWNAVMVEGEWRIMDCSLASPSNPRRSYYSSTNSQMAESWWFLARPTEIGYTHVPLHAEQQHIVPAIPNEVLLSLPCVCPTYFKNSIEMYDFDTSLLHLENLEMAHIQLLVPEDIECVAEVEVRGFARDTDGDLFESGEFVCKPALAQAEWTGGRKRITVKALLPGDEGQGVLKIYAGKRGLMVR